MNTDTQTGVSPTKQEKVLLRLYLAWRLEKKALWCCGVGALVCCCIVWSICRLSLLLFSLSCLFVVSWCLRVVVKLCRCSTDAFCFFGPSTFHVELSCEAKQLRSCS